MSFYWLLGNPIRHIFTFFTAQRIHVQFVVEVPARLNQTILNWNITPRLQTTSSWKFIESEIITIFTLSNCKWLYLVDAAQKKFLNAVITSESARRILSWSALYLQYFERVKHLKGFELTKMYIATLLSTLLCVVLLAWVLLRGVRTYVGSVTLWGLLLLVAVPA